MSSLPTEVLSLIASHFCRDDVRNFRLASHRFANIGIQHLNIGKYFYYRKHSLERLHRIATHPVLSRYLEEICFYVDILPEFYSRHSWDYQASAICHTTPLENDKLAISWLKQYEPDKLVSLTKVEYGLFRDTGWRNQERIRIEQLAMLDSEDTLISLQRSFSRLSGLRKFSLDTFDQLHSKRMRPLYALEPSQAWYCYNLYCALASFRRVTTQIFHAALVSRNMFDSVRNIKSHFTSLKITSTDFADFHQYLDASQYALALKYVRSFHLEPIAVVSRIDPPSRLRNMPFCNPMKIGPVLQQLLQQTTNLRYLRLSVIASPTLNSQAIFKNHSWAELFHLDLSHLVLDIPSFKAFLTSHTRSLKQLRLSDVTIGCPGGRHAWIELFKFIKDNLELSELGLNRMLYDQHRQIAFSSFPTHTFSGSGVSISKCDVARILICNQSWSDEKFLRIGRDELSMLSWADLLTADF